MSSNDQGRNLFSYLPEELAARCLAVLPFVDVVTCSRVCGEWYDLRDSKPFRAARELVDERALVFAGYIDEDIAICHDCFGLYRGRWRRLAFKQLNNDGPPMVIGNRLVNLTSPPNTKTSFGPRGQDGEAFDMESNTWRPANFGHQGHISQQTFTDPFVVALIRKAKWSTEPPIYSIESHRLGDDDWIDIPPPPLGFGGRAYDGATIYGMQGVLYLMGGSRGWGNTIDTMQAFDLTTRTWRVCPPLPKPGMGHLAVEINGRLFVLCGGDGDELRENTVHSFDPTDETWRKEPSVPMNQVRTSPCPWGMGISAAAHEGRLVLFGLENSPPLELVDGAWSPLPQVPCLGNGRSASHPQIGSLPLWC